MKVRFIYTLLVVIGLYFIWFIYGKSKSDHQPQILVEKIHSNYLNEDLFIKKISWGLTYDHSIIILSNSPNKSIEPDSNSEYMFSCSSIFYKLSNDSLLIFTSLKAELPLNFSSNIKVIQYKLENFEIMNLRENNNYKKKGLIMVY